MPKPVLLLKQRRGKPVSPVRKAAKRPAKRSEAPVRHLELGRQSTHAAIKAAASPGAPGVVVEFIRTAASVPKNLRALAKRLARRQ